MSKTKKKTIDHVLRSTWQSVAKMYNEEAAKYNGTMAVGFALLSIDPKKEHHQLHLVQRWGWKQQACQEH